MFNLNGKNALITGASGGIGRAIAETLHTSGATLTISGTRMEPLEELARSLGDRVHIMGCDLSNGVELENLSKGAQEKMGSVDILVNNAGITRDNLFLRMTDEDWASVLEVNLTSTMKLCRGVLRGMMKSRWGRIVNIGSVVGSTGNPGQGNYAASKAALVGMSKSLANEVASRGITVNCIAPGWIDTEMTEELPENSKKDLLDRIPISKIGKPEDIAYAAVFLASNEASYITGQTITVDGGRVIN